MSSFHEHRTSSAKPGPPTEPPKPPPPAPPPRWLHTLWLAGLLGTLVLLFLPGPTKSRTDFTYSEWKGKVDADQVRTATIDPSGKVTGELADKDKTAYSSRIPTALKDDALAGELAADRKSVV